MRSIASIAAFASVCLLPLPGHAQDVNGFEARTLQGTKGLTLPYRLYKVKSPTAGMKYPLILFLHGAGERGNNNTSQLMANAGATVWATDAHQTKNPAYVIAPQCPADKQWVDTNWGLGSYSTTTVPVSDQLTTALEIADAVAKEFTTDPARQYITGLSMGGYGTWDAIIRNPTRFAAAIPICGAGDPSKADLIKLLPIWTANGSADTTVPPKGTHDMVDALKAAGSTVKYDEYPGVGHDSWTMTYANEAVIDWLFTNKKDVPATGGAGGSGGMAGSSAGSGGSGGTSASAGAGGTLPSAGAGTGGSTAAGAPTGGVTAGSGTGGSAGTPTSAGTGGSSMVGTIDPGDDSSCSFHAPSRENGSRSTALLLGGGALLLLSQRRRKLAATRPPSLGSGEALARTKRTA
jgi:dienelactone hydrolase